MPHLRGLLRSDVDDECVRQVERHAFATYDRFLKEEGEQLKALPPPRVAKEYYQTGDLYMFDEFHTNKVGGCVAAG
jgi:ubiquinol oxidase